MLSGGKLAGDDDAYRRLARRRLQSAGRDVRRNSDQRVGNGASNGGQEMECDAVKRFHIILAVIVVQIIGEWHLKLDLHSQKGFLLQLIPPRSDSLEERRVSQARLPAGQPKSSSM